MRLNITTIIYSALYLVSILLSACGGGGSGGSGGGGTASYTVGGTISGLTGSVVLQDNNGDNLTVAANGVFTFATKVANGSTYNVTVLTQPTGQTCVVSSFNGTISGNVNNVAVVCATNTYSVGGTVSGLTGSVTLQDNSVDNLTVINGNFTFATKVASGSAYKVTVLTQPTGQTCSVSTSAGTVSGHNVTNVVVVCSSNSYTVGVSVAGLTGSVVLQDNNGDNLTVAANGTFTFATQVANGSPYSVTVLTQPQSCSVASGTGTIASADVTTVAVNCVIPTPRFAYVANYGSDNISAYSITSTGALTQVPCGGGADCSGNNFPAGMGPSFVTVEPSGKFAYVANWGSSDVSAYTIDASTGALTAVTGSPFRAGNHPYSVSVDPSGQFAYVANYGSDNISAYTINTSTGALTSVGPVVAAGWAPSSIIVDPSGRFAYVANQNSNNVSAYTITSTGALTPVGTVAAGINPSSVTIDPSGKFAYVANYISSDVSAYTINASTGALTPVAGSPFGAGASPYSVTVDPSGQFAYVANWGSSDVSAYRIDSTGALTQVPCGGAGCSGNNFPAGTNPTSVTTTGTIQ